jgi:hypothetical protein
MLSSERRPQLLDGRRERAPGFFGFARGEQCAPKGEIRVAKHVLGRRGGDRGQLQAHCPRRIRTGLFNQMHIELEFGTTC